MTWVKVTEDFYDTRDYVHRLLAGRTDVGAMVTFTGLVRDFTDGQAPDDAILELEHYPGMTEAQLEELREQAVQKFDLKGAAIVHRVGKMKPGEEIVLVIAASAHRQAAFDGANWIMDTLKTTAAFWKKESAGSAATWVKERQSDLDAAAKWQDERSQDK